MPFSLYNRRKHDFCFNFATKPVPSNQPGNPLFRPLVDQMNKLPAEKKLELIKILKNDASLNHMDLHKLDYNKLVEIGLKSFESDNVKKLLQVHVGYPSKEHVNSHSITSIKKIFQELNNDKVNQELEEFNKKHPNPAINFEQQMKDLEGIVKKLSVEENFQIRPKIAKLKNDLNSYFKKVSNNLNKSVSRRYWKAAALVTVLTGLSTLIWATFRHKDT